MSTTTIATKKRLTNTPYYLPVGQTSGSFKISIPFLSEYIMVLNNTIATIAVCIGDQSSQGPEAQLWTPGDYISMPLIEETQKLTVFWESDTPIAADSNLVQFYFSNVTIPLQGGSYGSSAKSQNVVVENTVTTQFASAQNVNVASMPSLPAGNQIIGNVIVTDGVHTQAVNGDGSTNVSLAGSNYLDLGIVTQGTNMAAGATMIGGEYLNLQWVRKIIFLGQSDQQYDIYMYRCDSSKTYDWGSLVSPNNGLTGVGSWRPLFMDTVNGATSTNSPLIGYGVKFGIKNSSAVANTFAKLKAQLLGL